MGYNRGKGEGEDHGLLSPLHEHRPGDHPEEASVCQQLDVVPEALLTNNLASSSGQLLRGLPPDVPHLQAGGARPVPGLLPLAPPRLPPEQLHGLPPPHLGHWPSTQGSLTGPWGICF